MESEEFFFPTENMAGLLLNLLNPKCATRLETLLETIIGHLQCGPAVFFCLPVA